MKGRTIHLDRWGTKLVAAMMVDGRLDDLLIETPNGIPVPGAIYRARVDRPLKGQGGLIVHLPDGGRGFLKRASGLSPGQSLAVQVTGFADPGKATPVSAQPIFKSRHVIATPEAPGYNVSRQIKDPEQRDALLEIAHETAGPPEDIGLIIRSGAVSADPAEVAEDIAATLDLAAKVASDSGRETDLLFDGPDPHVLAWREWPQPDAIFTQTGNFRDHGIDDRIDALRHPRADLPGGGWIAVEPTSALVAVDVNTGTDTSLAAGLKADIAAARLLPSELRCRGLGGQVTIDMAPAPKKDRRQIESALRSSFRLDPISSVLAGWTPLGHFEIQRKRERLPLSVTLPQE